MARRYNVSEATISRLLAASRAGALKSSANGQAGKETAPADRIAGALVALQLIVRFARLASSTALNPNTVHLSVWSLYIAG